MRVPPSALWALVIAVALSAVVLADPADPTPPADPAQPAAAESPVLPSPELQLRASTVRVRELLNSWDTQQLRLAELRAELAGTGDRARVVALEAEIERVKFETDLEILRIQAQHARREGQVELAEQLEGTVARLSAQRRKPPSKSETPAIQVQPVPVVAEEQQ